MVSVRFARLEFTKCLKNILTVSAPLTRRHTRFCAYVIIVLHYITIHLLRLNDSSSSRKRQSVCIFMVHSLAGENCCPVHVFSSLLTCADQYCLPVRLVIESQGNKTFVDDRQSIRAAAAGSVLYGCGCPESQPWLSVVFARHCRPR